MISEINAAQRIREDLINIIKLIKPAAIAAGFDYPTAEPQTATIQELRDFIEEVTFFIQSYAIERGSLISQEF